MTIHHERVGQHGTWKTESHVDEFTLVWELKTLFLFPPPGSP